MTENKTLKENKNGKVTMKKTNEAKTLLEKLKVKRDTLNARIQAAEARSKTSERKKETRRKILVGAYFLEEAIKANQMEDIKQKMGRYLMGRYLTRESDRKLFDLPDLVEEQELLEAVEEA